MCDPILDPACIITAPIAAAASGVIGQVSAAIQDGVKWVVTGSVSWWVTVRSPNLVTEPAVGALQQWIRPAAVAVAVISMIAAGGKMALTRKANPLIDVGAGLMIIAATAALGVIVPALLLQAGDAWSTWILDRSTGGQFGTRMAVLMGLGGVPAGAVIVLGIVAIVLSVFQAILMIFRQGAVILLAGVLPLAAAGSMTALTKPWFRRVTGWMLALIFYKPVAAAVYATAFTMIGTGDDPRTIFTGFAMVVLSLVALPVLMRFFTWATGAAESAASGGFLGAVIGGAAAVGALRASSGGLGGVSAADQARAVSAQLGPGGAAPPPASPQPPAPAPRPAAPGGPGTPAAGTAAAAASGPAAGGAGAARAAGAGTGGLGAAAAGPAGVVVLGAQAGLQAARGGAARLADGAGLGEQGR